MLYDYQVDIAYLSEAILDGTGCRNIKVPRADSHYWSYHNGSETSVQQGTAVALIECSVTFAINITKNR